MEDGTPPAKGPAGRDLARVDAKATKRKKTAWVAPFVADQARAILWRTASGESLASICADPAMPHRRAVGTWSQHVPVFRAGLARAKAMAGRGAKGGPASTYDPVVAAAIFDRLCEGESVTRICEDPAMPCLSTVYLWRKRVPAFAEMMKQAREIRAERFCDEGWEIASAVTPQTAFATEVRLRQLRWMCGHMAPRVYGRIKPLESAEERDGEDGGGMTVIIRRFTDAPDPELDGAVLQPGEERVLPNPARRLKDDPWL